LVKLFKNTRTPKLRNFSNQQACTHHVARTADFQGLVEDKSCTIKYQLNIFDV